MEIRTDRLILRLPQASDFDRYAETLGDEEAARYIGGAQSRAAAWRRFLQMPGAWALQGFAMFSVVEQSSGLWVGQCGPWRPEGWPGNEVGWTFAHAEGEGDECLEDWRDGHRAYFTRNGGFAPDMLLWCERFRLVEVIGQ